jgi:hypothetical protein
MVVRTIPYSKWYSTLVVLYTNMSDKSVKFECEREDVVIVRGVPAKKNTVQ